MNSFIVELFVNVRRLGFFLKTTIRTMSVFDAVSSKLFEYTNEYNWI